MYCSKCGANIDGMNFCPNCGQKVEKIGKTDEKPEVISKEGEDVIKNTEICKIAMMKACKNGRKKMRISILCGIFLVAAAVFCVFKWKERIGTTTFEFCGYEVGIPDTFSYNEKVSKEDKYVRFNDVNGGTTRLDMIYAGVCNVEENGLGAEELIHMAYSQYKIPEGAEATVIGSEQVDSIMGLYTVKGELEVSDEDTPWTVYAVLNRDYELFYFILMDGSDDMTKAFEKALYKTQLKPYEAQ